MIGKWNSTLSMMLVLMSVISGCTSIKVRPVDATPRLQHVCIEKNPKVTLTDFVRVVEAGFNRHGISTEVYSGTKPDKCEYTLTYTALRSWDFAPYLSVAELNLFRNGLTVASAEYHLRLKGGFSLMKWQGTKTKMDPVIDELLKNYKGE
ncbi:MAG: Sbal_3080 family lipoprotein [Candidatus Omnitrophota bacterium]